MAKITSSEYKKFLKQDALETKKRNVGHFVIENALVAKSCCAYLAHHKHSDIAVVIKHIHINDLNSEKYNRYLAEAQNHSLLRHPFIAKLYSVTLADSYRLLLIEYGGDNNILEYTQKQYKLDEDEARRLFRQMISAVDYLHQNRIVHRNLKPGNFCLDKNNNIKVIGFSHSSRFELDEMVDSICKTSVISSPEIVGKTAYTGPEVDIWALGIVLYFMLTGNFPFVGNALHNIHTNAVKVDYPASEYISEEVCDLLDKIFVVDQSKRITLEEIIDHPWVNLKFFSKINSNVPVRPAVVLDPHAGALKKMKQFGYSPEYVEGALSINHRNPPHIVCTYHLLQETRFPTSRKPKPIISNDHGQTVKALEFKKMLFKFKDIFHC